MKFKKWSHLELYPVNKAAALVLLTVPSSPQCGTSCCSGWNSDSLKAPS